MSFPTVALSEIAHPVTRPVSVIAGMAYRTIGVKWWGEGAYERDTIDGSQTAAKTLSLVHEGDLIINKIWVRHGSTAIASKAVDGCAASSEFPTFELDCTKVLPRWIHWLTKSRDFWSKCDTLSHGTSGKNRIKPELFLTVQIPFPPLSQQRRIVARLEELAAKIEEARGLRREAMEEAEKVISRTISNLQFDERYWTTIGAAVLDKKGSIRSGPFGGQLHHDEFVNSGVAAIGTRDVQVQDFTLNSGWFVTHQKFEQFKRYQVFPGNVLVTIVGGSIGRFCVVPENVPLAFTTKHVIALTLDPSKAIPEFISYLLNFHTRCRTSLFSQSEGSAQPSLNSTKILRTEIPLPLLVEQQHIITYIDDIYAKVKVLQHLQSETSAELDALLPSILDKAFKGEL